VSDYKYLGVRLNSKLTAGPQIAFIKKKAAHLFDKLYPYIKQASADARRDAFMTFVQPLFDAAVLLLHYEPSITQRDNLIRIHRIIFKQFMFISKRTSTNLVNELINKDLIDRAEEVHEQANEKWEARLQFRSYSSLPREESVNLIRAMPNSFCTLINTGYRPCPICNTKGVITSRWHLKYAHKICLPPAIRTWREKLKPISSIKKIRVIINGKVREKVIPRTEVKKNLDPILNHELENFKRALSCMMTN